MKAGISSARLPTRLPMYTGNLPIEDWSPAEVARLNRLAERNQPLQLMADGSIKAALGKYALMFNALGNTVPFWAPRPADMKLGYFEVDNEKWARRLNRPLGDRIVGLFLQDLKNGNLGRIRVLDWHPARTIEYWLQDFIQDHQKEAREHRREHNILMRYNAHWFGTRGIEYRVHESKLKHPETGQTLHDVHVIISPWANMLLPRDDSLYTGIAGLFTRVASLRKKGMHLEEAHEWIRKDFRERGPLLYAHMDAYKDRPDKKRRYIHAKTSPKREKRVQARLREINRRNRIEKPEQYFYQRSLMKFAFATKDYGWRSLAKLVGKFGALNISVGVALIVLGMPQVGIPVIFGKIALQSAWSYATKSYENYKEAKGGAKDSDEELRRQEEIRKISHQYEPDDPNGGRFDPEERPYYSAIPNKELHSSMGNKYDAVAIFNAEQEVFADIAGLQNRLVGSDGTPHKVGEYEVSHVSQAGGLDVEYVPDLQTCYARLDQTRLGEFNLLSPELIKYFKNMPKGHPILRIVKDPHSGRLHGEALTYQQYLRKMEMLKRSPYQSRVLLPFKVPASPRTKEKPKTTKQLRKEFRKRGQGTVGEVAADFVITMADKTVELLDTLRPGP